eukprot:CAMPEP_0177593516 /NCGR_PEP_ID=MMETSP0419_2-20121207/9196_1 /TAXON_ID=582737 /ORGANISM="Tetraselmis sp., Strain GSL018" /LENGTH=145 /DNA_ID=CAMNT_0019084577 /DNA_START=438 /DNA_END=875 /DNA_ORIENTATION=+
MKDRPSWNQALRNLTTQLGVSYYESKGVRRQGRNTLAVCTSTSNATTPKDNKYRRAGLHRIKLKQKHRRLEAYIAPIGLAAERSTQGHTKNSPSRNTSHGAQESASELQNESSILPKVHPAFIQAMDEDDLGEQCSDVQPKQVRH